MSTSMTLTGAVAAYTVKNMGYQTDQVLTDLGKIAALHQCGRMSFDEAAHQAGKLVYSDVMHFRPRASDIKNTGRVGAGVYAAIIDAAIFDHINWQDVGGALVGAYIAAGVELDDYIKGEALCE